MSDQLGEHEPTTSSTTRLPMVIDHLGRGWTASPHGELTPSERSLCPEPYDDPDTVRLVRRNEGHDSTARLTIDDARTLATTLINAAREAEDHRNARYAQQSVDAEAERLIRDRAEEDERYAPADPGSLELLKHYKLPTETLEQALARLIREGPNMRPWALVVTIGAGQVPEVLQYRIQLVLATGGKGFPDGTAGRDRHASDPRQRWEFPDVDAERFSSQPLKIEEIALATRLGVMPRHIPTGYDPVFAQVRAWLQEYMDQQS